MVRVRIAIAGWLFFMCLGCSDKAADESIGAGDFEQAAFDAFLSIVSGALNDVEDRDEALSLTDTSRICPTSVGTCSGGDRTVLYDTNGTGDGDDYCVRQEVRLYGSVEDKFRQGNGTGVSTCVDFADGIPESDSLFRYTTTFLRRNPSGETVTTSTSNVADYNGDAHAGAQGQTGVRVRFETADQRSVYVYGVRRVYASSGGDTRFNVTAWTDNAEQLVFTGTMEERDRTITDGQMKLAFNNARVAATVSPVLPSEGESANTVVWGLRKCCYPSGGTLNLTFTDGDVTGTASLQFLALCGKATLTDRNGERIEVQLRACE